MFTRAKPSRMKTVNCTVHCDITPTKKIFPDKVPLVLPPPPGFSRGRPCGVFGSRVMCARTSRALSYVPVSCDNAAVGFPLPLQAITAGRMETHVQLW